MTETQAKSGTTGTSINPVTRDDLDGERPTSVGDHAVGRASVTAVNTSKIKLEDHDGGGAGDAESAGQAEPRSPGARASAPVVSALASSLPTGAVTKATGGPSADGPSDESSTPAGLGSSGAFSSSDDSDGSGSRQPDAGEAGRAVAEAARVVTDVKPAGTPSPASPAPAPGTSGPIGPGGRGHRPAAGAPAGPAGRTSTVAPDKRPAVGRSTAAPTSAGPATGAARVADAVRSARAAVTGAAQRGPRRARLYVKRVDPWSVMKFAFALSFVLFFVLIVATAVLYLALDSMDVFTSVNKAVADLVPGNNDLKITAGVVIGSAGAIGLVMVVLCTALSTLAAFIYNVCADLVGGIEVTLSEKE